MKREGAVLRVSEEVPGDQLKLHTTLLGDQLKIIQHCSKGQSHDSEIGAKNWCLILLNISLLFPSYDDPWNWNRMV